MEMIFLFTDCLLWFLVVLLIISSLFFYKSPYLKQAFYYIKTSKLGVICGMIVLFYLVIALADSIHFKVTAKNTETSNISSFDHTSLLDLYLTPWHSVNEKTYSLPFDNKLYLKVSKLDKKGKIIRYYPHLTALESLPYQNFSKLSNIIFLILVGVLKAYLLMLGLFVIWMLYYQKRFKLGFANIVKNLVFTKFETAWLTFWLISFVLISMALIAKELLPYFHIFGTDKVGNDIFYLTIKSIRTGVVIGTVTTLILLPFAIIFGILSGYFGGLVDDIIQYIYTTLNSIPGILLIASFSLLLSAMMTKYSTFFSSNLARADIRLLGLCFILGITSWSSLCRLLRAETLKVKQLDYIRAAKTLGSSNLMIITKHILPNIFHLVLISIVLDFSGLVLAETILSYVGIGVDPTMPSWGNMINSARLELAREPIVWWPLLAAFSFMFVLVLAANLFSDVIRDALDPKLR